MTAVLWAPRLKTSYAIRRSWVSITGSSRERGHASTRLVGAQGAGPSSFIRRSTLAQKWCKPSGRPSNRVSATRLPRGCALLSPALSPWSACDGKAAIPASFEALSPRTAGSRSSFALTPRAVRGGDKSSFPARGALVWDEIGLFEADTLEERLAKEWEDRLSSGTPSTPAL